MPAATRGPHRGDPRDPAQDHPRGEERRRAGGRGGDVATESIVREEIRARGPITFARFMDLALHHPEHGYYARGPARLGVQGDFFTASDLGPAFGRCLARQLAEMSERLGGPRALSVVELGGGRGLLASDVLEAWESLGAASRLDYLVVDRSAAMRRSAEGRGPRVLPPERLGRGYEGCVLAVELLDALPVHRVRRRKGELREVLVDTDSRGRLVEREGDPLPEVLAFAERYDAAPEDDDEGEVGLAALDLMGTVDRCLERGFVVIVDYGHEAARLYGPAHRRGTLLAYHRHAAGERYLERVGEQDLTAHVNWTSIEDRARELGLDVLGRTTQDRFLISNGILEPFDERDAARWRDPARVRERLQIRQLVHPSGMGRRFEVLVLSKGVPAGARLAGLRDPFGDARPGRE